MTELKHYMDRLGDYAQVVGYLEGSLKFILTWTDDEEIKKSAITALEFAENKLWGERDVQD